MDLDICCVSVCVTTKEEALANAAPYTFSGSTGPPHFFGEEKYWVLGGSAYSLRLLEKSGHFSHLSGPWSESCGSGARTHHTGTLLCMYMYISGNSYRRPGQTVEASVFIYLFISRTRNWAHGTAWRAVSRPRWTARKTQENECAFFHL